MTDLQSVGHLEVVLALSDALDLVSPLLVGHHKRVACIAQALAAQSDLGEEERSHVVLAAALHDCGAFSLKTRLDSLEFEWREPHHHAEAGYHLLGIFKPLSPIRKLVRYHHRPWDQGRGLRHGGEDVPPASHVLHLADRVSVLIDDSRPVLEQKQGIIEAVNRKKGTLFNPATVDAFNSLADLEYFWFDAVSPDITSILTQNTTLEDIRLDTDEFKDLVKLFYHIIDFRSHFTATHTSGVRACAETLAGHCGFSALDGTRMGLAACVHDLGKLAIPLEILEKKSTLTHHEQVIMRGHPYYGHRILDRFPALKDINTWASLHHERVDGTGYPFHVKGDQLPLGSRIMSIADVFTAITENRPYRRGMNGKEALTILESMAHNGKLDPDLVKLVRGEYDELNGRRIEAQQSAVHCYEDFTRRLSALSEPGTA